MLTKIVFRAAGILLAFLVATAPVLAGLIQEPAPPPPPQESKEAKAPATPAPASEPPAKAAPHRLLVPAGTRLPLVLHNAITTRNAKPGDPIYLETLFPVIVEGRIVFPAGSYVSGEIVEAKRPGRVKGRGELLVRLNMMILPNGYTVDFNAIPTGADTGGNETVEEEGRMKGDTDKSSDIGLIVKSSTIGLGAGAVIGRSAGGAGIGAGIGAAAGLIGTLLTRGPELELPRGTTLDVMLDRPLSLDSEKVQFTDPGRSSVLAGPPNRQPVRNKSPF